MLRRRQICACQCQSSSRKYNGCTRQNQVQQKVALRCFAPPTALLCKLEKARRTRFSANRSLQICSQSLQCMYLARRGSRKYRSTPCSPVASPCSQQTDPHIPTSETNIFGTEGARLSDGTADRKEWVCIDVRHIRTHTQTRSPDQIDKKYHMFRQKSKKTPKMGTRDCLKCKLV